MLILQMNQMEAMNRQLFEAQMPTLMTELREIFLDIDTHVKNRILDVYLYQRLHSSEAAMVLMCIGSRCFPQLGMYLHDTSEDCDYPQRKQFWAMFINMMCMKDNILDKPLALSTFDEWVLWLRQKYSTH